MLKCYRNKYQWENVRTREQIRGRTRIKYVTLQVGRSANRTKTQNKHNVIFRLFLIDFIQTQLNCCT